MEQIYKSVLELAEMFQELSTLVIEQGSILDRIDINIENTRNHMRKAHNELIKAYKWMKCSRLTLCLILMLVVMLFVSLAVGIKFGVRVTPIILKYLKIIV